MLVEIRGTQFENKGAGLMRDLILIELFDRFPNIKIAMSGRDRRNARACPEQPVFRLPNWSKGPVDLNFLQYWVPSFLRKPLRSVGFVFEPDLFATIDASGFAYSDQWSPYPIIRLHLRVWRARKRGQRYILVPQAFGPFLRRLDRLLMKDVLSRVDFVAARDQESRSFLKELNAGSDIDLYPDITIGVGTSAISGSRSEVLVVPNTRMMTVLTQAKYVELLKRLVVAAEVRGLRPVVLNHGGQADAGLCQSVAQILRTEVLDPPTAMAAKGLIGGASLIISSRFHACVSGLSQGVPCVATSWSHKYEELFTSFGHPEWVLGAEVSDVAIDSIIGGAMASERRQLAEAAAGMRADLSDMWDRVDQLLASGSR